MIVMTDVLHPQTAALRPSIYTIVFPPSMLDLFPKRAVSFRSIERMFRKKYLAEMITFIDYNQSILIQPLTANLDEREPII